MTPTDLIQQKCTDLATFLCEKNAAYGNSALEPVNIFAKASAVEQIAVRIDDKLNRLMKGREYAGDDTFLDVAGYLVLYLIARDQEKDAC